MVKMRKYAVVIVREETHIPDWRLGQYVALTGLAHMEACA